MDLDAIILGEFHENEVRKDFTVSERVAIGKALEALGNRQGGEVAGRIGARVGDRLCERRAAVGVLAVDALAVVVAVVGHDAGHDAGFVGRQLHGGVSVCRRLDGEKRPERAMLPVAASGTHRVLGFVRGAHE